jgi:acetylornithine aminotransferase
VLAEQSARIAHTGFNYSSCIVEEAGREILALLGLAGGRCVFLAAGSEAVEYGVRVAQEVNARPLLMTMTDSYFGAYGSASRKQENEWFCFDWAGCAACPDARACDARCERWTSIPIERIGGFLLEPGSSSGLVRFPPGKLITSIVRAVRDAGGLVLVNEVTTGVGRTGTWFGYQHYGIAPDVVALGKGIGNGYPVSVTAFSPRAIERQGDRPLKYSQSHQNDPLGAAIALEVVRVIRNEGLIEHSQEISRVLLGGLEALRARAKGRIREVRGRGLMAAVELADDDALSLTIRVQRELVRRGYILARRPGLNVLRIDPPLTIERRDVEGFLATFKDVLGEPAAGA